MMDISLLTTELRSTAYKLLSDCYRIPDPELPVTFNRLQSIISELTEDIPESGIMHMSAGSIPDIDILKRDHARLFVGPFTPLAPPYGSMYLDKTDHLMTESTMQVQQWYASEGLETGISEVPDHLRIELEFMYLLAFRQQQEEIEMQNVGNRSDTTATTYRDKQMRFLEEHLGGWIQAFAQKVNRHAQTDFYRVLASLTKQWVLTDYRLHNKFNLDRYFS